MAAREDARARTGQEPEVPVFTVLKNSAILKNIFLINSSSSVDETHREDSSKNRQDLEKNFVVGRHPDCDIRLEHPSVSRFHLRIHSKPSAKRLSVTDLSSAHGTWISGKRIRPKIRVDVNEGDALRIGASSRVYRLHWVPLQKAYSSKPFIPPLDLPPPVEENEEEMRLDENALESENGVETADSVAVASQDANLLLLKREGDERPLVSGCECFVDSAFEAIRALVCNQFEVNVVQDENAACSKEDGKALESSFSEGSMQSALNPNFKPLENLQVLSVAPQPEAMKAVETQLCLDKGNDAILEHEEVPMMLNLEDNSDFSKDMGEGQEDEDVQDSRSATESIGQLKVDAPKGTEHEPSSHDGILEHEEDPAMLELEDNSILSDDMEEGQEEDEEVQDSGSSIVSIGELEVDASKGTGHEHTSHDAVLECEEDPMMLNSESSNFSEEMEEDQEEEEEEVHFSGSSIGSIGELEVDPPKGSEHEPTTFAEWIDSPLPIESIDVETENLNFVEENQSLEVDLFSEEPSPIEEISANEHMVQLCNDAEQDDSWSFWSPSRQTETLESQSISIDEENQGSEGGKSSQDPTSRAINNDSLWSFWSMMEGPESDLESLPQAEMQSPNQSPRTCKLFTDEDIPEEDCFTPVKENFTSNAAKRQSPARLSPLSSAAKSLSKSAKRENQRTPLQTLSCYSNKENQTPEVLKLHSSSMVKKGVTQRTPLRALSMESPQKSVSKNSMSGGATLSAVSNKENQTPKIIRQERKSARILSPEPSNLFTPKREADAEKLPFRSLFLDSSEESMSECFINENQTPNILQEQKSPLQTLFVDSPQKSPDFITSENSENKKGFADQAKRWTMVVDITCLLNENSRRALQLLEGIKGTQLVVPEAVVKELDSMKQQQQTGIFRKSSDSFSASEWIEECLIRTKRWIQVHSSSDSVLDLALRLKRMQKDRRLVLLSDDFSSKIKAMEEGLICESAAEFRKSLVNPFSSRFLWAGSLARGRTWSCLDDVILRRNFYPDCMMKGVENAKGLKLALLQN